MAAPNTGTKKRLVVLVGSSNNIVRVGLALYWPGVNSTVAMNGGPSFCASNATGNQLP